jgi:hypothetical protein
MDAMSKEAALPEQSVAFQALDGARAEGFEGGLEINWIFPDVNMAASVRRDTFRRFQERFFAQGEACVQTEDTSDAGSALLLTEEPQVFLHTGTRFCVSIAVGHFVAQHGG